MIDSLGWGVNLDSHYILLLTGADVAGYCAGPSRRASPLIPSRLEKMGVPLCFGTVKRWCSVHSQDGPAALRAASTILSHVPSPRAGRGQAKVRPVTTG